MCLSRRTRVTTRDVPPKGGGAIGGSDRGWSDQSCFVYMRILYVLCSLGCEELGMHVLRSVEEFYDMLEQGRGWMLFQGSLEVVAVVCSLSG